LTTNRKILGVPGRPAFLRIGLKAVKRPKNTVSNCKIKSFYPGRHKAQEGI
jgi:hypothetical protein